MINGLDIGLGHCYVDIIQNQERVEFHTILTSGIGTVVLIPA
jgi:hypothetical protein